MKEASTETAKRDWPIGTEVVVTRDSGERVYTRTRSEPWELCGTWVVLVKGISGGYSLSRMTKTGEAAT